MGTWRTLTSLMVVGIVGLVVVVIAVNLINAQRQSIPTAQSFSPGQIIQRIEPLGELVTYRYPIAEAGREIQMQFGLGGICSVGANHVIQGEVQAGIDLDQLAEGDVTNDKAINTYRIVLPAARLTSCTLDPIDTQQYQRWGSTPFCPADFDEIRRLASYDALVDFRDAAISEGIFEDAERQAKVVLENFIGALTESTIIIDFTARENVLVNADSSCMPVPPDGWSYSEQNGQWEKN